MFSLKDQSPDNPTTI